jgi:endoglucanase
MTGIDPIVREVAMDILSVKKDRIVDRQGKAVFLRGFAVGGWMNLEHFMNGYPGAEHQLRAVMAQELGEQKAQFFFNRLLDTFFTEEDVIFIRSLGASVIRLAVNYRHFEADDRPFHYLEAGFQRLGQALDWCRKHGLYVILDLHAVQGWQNSDWHCDNASRHSLFWGDRLYQDRFVALWQEFARRFKGDPAVAGYDLMNEPLVGAPFGRFREHMTIQLDHQRQYHPDWPRMNAVYQRAVEAIRAIDPDHIIFLEGDYFSNLFEGLTAPFAENLAYSSHTYNPGPGANWGVDQQRQWHYAHEGTIFTRRHQVPLFAGEFGGGTSGDPERVEQLARVIDGQAQLYNQEGDHWTIWNYKDIGAMGSVYLQPDSAYVRAIQPVLQAKLALEVDHFSGAPSQAPVKQKLAELARIIETEIQDPTLDSQVNQSYLEQHMLSGYAAQLMQKKFAQCFVGMSEDEIDQVLQSHLLRNCARSEPTLAFLRRRFNE